MALNAFDLIEIKASHRIQFIRVIEALMGGIKCQRGLTGFSHCHRFNVRYNMMMTMTLSSLGLEGSFPVFTNSSAQITFRDTNNQLQSTATKYSL